MRQSQSAVLERGAVLASVHETEPFEVSWAGEARWFVVFLDEEPATTVSMQVQVSPNGIQWVDHEAGPVETAAEGTVSIPVREFGHWLRLRTTSLSGDRAPRARIYLALKE